MKRLVAVMLGVVASAALALDKQGSAHATGVNQGTGFNLSGSAMVGVSLFNPSYAARPDNTGLALMRYAGHLDVDLLGPKLSVPVDLNFFTDRERGGLEALEPTEFDVITGLTSTWTLGPGDLELGSRFEHDMPIDRGGFTQMYVDARARYRLALAGLFPALGTALRNGDVSGWVTLGGFLFNPSYAARPDNSGLALLRYAAHVEVSAFDDLLSVGFDATLFTDRTASWLGPSELDFTTELIFHKGRFEAHLAYERDMPVDRPGLVQHFVFLAGAVSFDLANDVPRAFTDKNAIHSP